MSSLPKPELRGHLKRYIIKSLIGAFVFGGINCSLFYYFYMKRRIEAYAEFARTYDPEEHLKILKKYGYLQSTQ